MTPDGQPELIDLVGQTIDSIEVGNDNLGYSRLIVRAGAYRLVVHEQGQVGWFSAEVGVAGDVLPSETYPWDSEDYQKVSRGESS